MRTLLAAAVLFFGWIAGAHAACPNYNTSQPNTTATSLSVMTADRVNITGGCINGVDVLDLGTGGGGAAPHGSNGDIQTKNGAAFGAITPGTGVATALAVNVGTDGAVLVKGGALGTPSSGSAANLTGLPITGGTTGTLGVARGGTGLTTVAADQVYVGTAADTFTAKSIADCDDSAGNHLNYDTTTHAFSCGNSASGGGGATGFGVDGGGSAQAVTGTATISNGTRVVKVASGWATGTLTLPAISAVSSDTCIRVEDGGNFVDATHTLTLKGGASDGLNGGAANGTIGAFTTSGAFLIACVSAANNWNVGPGSIATSSASSTQIVSGVDINGLTYATVVAAVKTFWATPSSANLRSALSDETGTGLAYFQGGDIGTPSAGVGTNITGVVNNNVLAVTLATGTSVSLTAPREYYICTGTCTVTPPVPAAGYEFCVMNDDNVATVITLAAIGSSARYEATARTSYGTAGTGTFVSGGAAGDKVCLLGRDSTHYLTVSYNGTWTAN